MTRSVAGADLVAAWLWLAPALAQDQPLRFASLDSGEVNLRAGPGKDYPILWVYQRKGLPVEIIQEFDTWRRIRDRDGTVGWCSRPALASAAPSPRARMRSPDRRLARIRDRASLGAAEPAVR